MAPHYPMQLKMPMCGQRGPYTPARCRTDVCTMNGKAILSCETTLRLRVVHANVLLVRRLCQVSGVDGHHNRANVGVDLVLGEPLL
jgi:hypothetical protein